MKLPLVFVLLAGCSSSPSDALFDASPDAGVAAQADGGPPSDATSPEASGIAVHDAANEVGAEIDAQSPGDACAYVHDDGIGGVWIDCAPAGTLNNLEAAQACSVYGGTSAECATFYFGPVFTGGDCAPTTAPQAGGFRAICSTDGSGQCGSYCWGYEGAGAGNVYTCGCLDVGQWQ